MNHIEIVVEELNSPKIEELIVAFTAIGFDGFEEGENYLKAYISEDKFIEGEIKELSISNGFKYSLNVLKEQNWNESWEKNYDPVIVDDFVSVRATFHEPIQNVQHEILITPKMSFGTGHHATTYLVLKLMSEIDFSNKKVFDFGTGTGILAIMAEKLGAEYVEAVDYDNWCIENAQENIEQNKSSKIKILQKDTAESDINYDIVIANINRNIIIDNLANLDNLAVLNNKSVLLLSGLLVEDELEITELFENKGWEKLKTLNKNGWIALRFVK